MTRRFLLALALVPAASAAAADVRILPIDPEASPRFVRVSPDGAAERGEVAQNPSSFCLAGSQGVLQFDSTTGAYVGCGAGGFFEQGVGTVTTQSSGEMTLSHFFSSWELKSIESVHATVNPTTGQGSAAFNARDETHGTFPKISITTSNVFANSCGGCPSQTAINEGFLNSFPIPSKTVGFGPTTTDATVLQQFTLNPDFNGRISRFVMGVGRQGSGRLSFDFRFYSDRNGLPGDPIYTSPTLRYSDFPGLPVLGLVSEPVNIGVNDRILPGLKFWAGIHWNPQTDPLDLPYGTNSDSPLSKTATCNPTQGCNLLTGIQNFDDVRSLYLSADVQSEWLATGGVVAYGNEPKEILSDKCDGSYYRYDYNGNALIQLYAENGPGTSFAPVEYDKAFARVAPILAELLDGLDGIAETRYNGMRYSAFSYTSANSLKYCTRPGDATDFVCHTVGDFAGGGKYTRIAGVKNGFELSYGDALGDRIYRWTIANGATGWQSQPLNPLLGQIGNPEFGFPWYAAVSSKVGVAYEYQTSTGLPQVQLTVGNVFYGPFPLGTDVPPQGFNPALASRMAGDCTRDGLCVFGRFQTVSQKNLVDMVDFRESLADPEIKTWQIGSGLPGLQFGRAVSLRERDGTALYASYTPSSISNQYRLQFDALDLAQYTKFTFSYDFGAGAGNYPVSLSREGGEWGLAHKFGIGLLYNREAGCQPSRIRGHESGGAEGTGSPLPCQIPIVGKF